MSAGAIERDTSIKSSATKPESRLKTLLNLPLADYYMLLSSSILLVSLGLLMVLSSSSVVAEVWTQSSYFYVHKQLAFLIAGIPLAWFIIALKPKVLQRFAWLFWLLAVGLLTLTTPASPFASTSGGNTNWIEIFGARLQPSEFAKLALIVWAAAVFANKKRKLDQPKHLLIPFIPGVALILALILLGRDLGTALVLGMVVFSLLWFVGAPVRILALLSTMAAAVVAVLVAGSQNRMQRIWVWIDPSHHTDIASQPMASLYALASGGWWGLGLGHSRQKWGALKNGPHTDFVFAVLGEEFGLVGVLFTLALFAVLCYAGIRVALRSDDLFCRIAAAGITAWFAIQGAVNILVVLSVLPVLGVPLPFLSYGGSALMASLLAMGVLLSCARNEPAARKFLEQQKAGPKPKKTVLVSGR